MTDLIKPHDMKAKEFKLEIERLITLFITYWDYSEHGQSEPYPSKNKKLYQQYEKQKQFILEEYAKVRNETEPKEGARGFLELISGRSSDEDYGL